VATQKPSRRSRKRRHGRPATAAPVAASRRGVDHSGNRPTDASDPDQDLPQRFRRRTNALSAYGERPPSPFGGVPVSEIAILAGAVALVVGFIRHGGPALVGGLVLCVLGVIEVTAREHFSGFRSHTVMLAAVPAVLVEALIAFTVGPPALKLLLLVPVAAVFAVCAWFLRRRFLVARQARLARPLKR
jgi:hypothetical protein